MSQAFNITARLNLQAPKNLKSVAQQIHRTLSGVGGNLNVGLGPNSNKQLQQVTQKLAGLKTQSAATTKAINATAASVDNFSNRLATTSKRVAAFGIAAGTLLTVFSAIRGGVRDAIDFQSEMVKISQITGKSTSQLKGLSEEIHGLSTGLGSSSRGLQQAANTLAQAGLSARDTKAALSALAKADLSPTFKSIRDTTEGSVALLGQFGQGVEKLESQLGSINTVSARFAVESSDLITAVRKSGGAFKAAGGNLQELLGLFTSVRSTTRESADSISSAFRTIFARLQRPKTQQDLKSLLGVDLSEGGQFVGPLRAIEKLHHALSDLPSGSLTFAKAAETIGGIRQISKVVPLIQQYGKAIEAVRVAEQGQLSLDKDAATAQESLNVQIARTKESWQKFFDVLVDDHGVKATIGSLLSLARGLASVADALRPIIPGLTAFAAIKFGGLAIPALGRGFGKIAGHHLGGLITGGQSGRDSVPSLLEPGEFVVRRSVAQKHLGALRKLNAGGHGVMKFKTGGLVPGGLGGQGGHPLNDDPFSSLGANVRNLIDVIKQEISVSRELLANQRRAASGTIPLSDDAGYSLAGTPTRRQRARSMVNRAMALPLARNDFETNAFNVVSGLPDDFRGRPMTYGVRPSMSYHEQLLYSSAFDEPAQHRAITRPSQGYRSFRSGLGDVSRADRLGLVNQFGKAGLLARLQSQNSLRSRLPSISSVNLRGLVPQLGSFDSRSGKTLLAGAGLLAFTGTGSHLAGRIGGKTGEAGFSGFVGGATAGATIGSLGGPAGAVIGGIVGGIGGLVSSLDELKRSVADQAAQHGLEAIASAAADLGKVVAGGKGNQSELLNKLFANQSAAEGGYKQAAAANAELSPFEKLRTHAANLLVNGGSNFIDFKPLFAEQEQERKSRENLLLAQKTREGLSSSAGAEGEILNSRLKSSRSFLDFNSNPENQRLLGNRIDLRLQDEVIRRGGSVSDKTRANLREHIGQEEIKALRIQKDEFDKRRLNLSAIDDFTRAIHSSVSSIEGFTDKLHDLEQVSQAFDRRSALLTGNGPAALANANISSSISRFGSAGFERFSSGLLGQANRAHLALGSVLPGLLNGSHDIGTDEGFGKLREGLAGAFNSRGVGGNVQENIFRQLDELRNTPDFAKTFGTGTNNNKLRDSLLAWSKDIQSAEVEAAKGLESHANKLSERIGQLGQLGNSILETRHSADLAHLSGLQFAASRREAAGLPSGLSLADEQRPFIANQARLTGLGNNSLNPSAILSSIQANRQGLLSAQARVEANPLDTKAIASVRLFESQLQKSVQALKNLGDASNLNASIMERLNKLDADRQGRLGLGEQFFGASPAERKKLGENAGFAAKALQHGTLDKLTPEEQQKAVSFFQSARDVRLFGGDKTGGQHLTNLINNSAGGVFRQTAQDQATVRGLEGAAAGNHGRAVQAQNGVAAVQGQNFADLAKGINASAAAFNQSIGTFGRNVDSFAKAAASIPHSLTMTARVHHELTINGAQMLQELMPNIARLVDSSARQIVDERIRKSLGLGQAQIS